MEKLTKVLDLKELLSHHFQNIIYYFFKWWYTERI